MDFIVVTTATKIDPSDETKQRVDMAMYRVESAPTEKEEAANWGAVDMSMECKPEEVADDPFDDDAEDFQPTSIERRANLGQIASYTALVFAKQQRTHHFSVIFLGRMARLIRWDRAGAVATRKFDYTAEPEKLGRFFWRYIRLSDAQRGHDPTVTRILTTDPEFRLMQERAEKPILVEEGEKKFEIGQHARLLFRKSLKSSKDWYKVRVGEEKRHFLVGAPHFIATALAGRGTRGYVAIDCADPYGPFVYLKDAWRVAHDSIEQEGTILAYLNDEKTGKVDRIPTLVCHGDVDDQVTDSQNVWKTLNPDALKCPLKTHRHYRLVVKEVGLSMDKIESAEELVYLIANCIGGKPPHVS